MKISPVAAGAIPAIPQTDGRSANPDRIARAKAALAGQQLPPPRETIPDRQVERAQASIKKIKMRTQRSPDRHIEEPLVQNPDALTETNPETGILDQVESTQTDVDAKQPLSPQFAALAKQKRALQLKEQELLAKEKALSSQPKDTTSLDEYRARIKANALKVLQEEGVTYDQLTEQILNSNQSDGELEAVKAELKALKDGFENQNKSLTDRDIAAETQVKAQIRRNVDQLIAQGDDFEMVREAGYAPKVVELIDKVWKKEGILLDEIEAATQIENELLEESLRFARIKKVQSRLTPATQTQQRQPASQQGGPARQVMRTLTNRDGASSISMSKRERAIAAMEGRLK